METELKVRKNKLTERKFLYQFLPISLEKISNTKKFIYKDKELKSAYVVDLIHNLLLKYYFKKENVFNLSAVILKEKYGYLYNYYINFLIDEELLILLKKHSSGKNARVYKMNDKIINQNIQRYKNFDSVLLKKYNKIISSLKNSEFDKNLIDVDVKQKLINDLFYVEVDFSKSLYFLDQSIQDLDVYNRNRYSVESIINKNIFYHFDNYGRLHTNFTILKSFIRKNCLIIDGEETCEIDIKNSQPLFLNKLFNKNNVGDLSELSLFRYLTIEGKFYQYLQEKLNIINKKQVKEITYKVLFGKNTKNKIDTGFSKIFPNIHRVIKEFKSEAKDYRALSYKLQRLESEFIFNKVIKSINNNYPNIILITVHDSIICKKSDQKVVESVFYDYMSQEFDNLD